MKKFYWLIFIPAITFTAYLAAQSTKKPVTKGPKACLADYEIVTHKEAVSASSSVNVHVDCPTGKKVISGGFNLENPDLVKVYASEPSDGHGNIIETGWNVFVRNTDRAARQVTVTAICAAVCSK